MQLPRGTFREILKKRPLGSIITDLEKSSFSGICSISAVAVAGTLVFRNGRFILAKIHGKAGDAAIHEIPPLWDIPVDAALSTLDATQIKLALEFNKQYHIEKTDIIQREPSHNNKSADLPSHVIHHHGKQPNHGNPDFHAVSRHPVGRTPDTHITPRPAVQNIKPRKIIKEEPVQQDTEEPDSFENDISTIEAMNLDNTSDKIRKECKTLVRQLNLEHLMERK